MHTPPCDAPPAWQWPRALPAGWVALALAEVLALSMRFDTAALAGDRGGWAVLLSRFSQSRLPSLGVRLGIAVAAATLLYAGARCHAPPRPQAHRPWPWAFGHLAAMAGFTWLTARVLDEGWWSRPCWVAAWVGLGLVAATCWGAALGPVLGWLPQVRHRAGALLAGAAVGSAACGAGWVLEGAWRPLGRWTLWLVDRLLSLVCRDTVCRPADWLVGTSAFAVEIAPGCSGYEGIGLIWVYLGAYLWLSRRRLHWPWAWLLLPLGTALIWVANAVRLAALVLIGAWVSPAVAVGGFHSQAGWLLFNAVGLGLVFLSRRTRLWGGDELSPAGAGEPNPTAAYLAPLAAQLTAAMIVHAVSPPGAWDWLYPVRAAVTAGVLWHYRGSYAELRRTWSWPAVALGAGAFVCWLVLGPARSGAAATPQGWAGLDLPWGLAAAWLVARGLGAVVMVPLAEELAFRGYLTRRLQAADFRAVAIGRFSRLSWLVTSVLFGMLHGQWLAGTVCGLVYGLALYRRGELTDAVVAHATTNALLGGYVVVTGSWEVWG
jgi:exosortase E/protease (VPEID-CTERM system)